MEAFESFVALTMEADGLVVSEALKFPVKRATAKAAYVEEQTHGFEVDLVGARRDRLVLATVKSFFGSRGVVSDHVMAQSKAQSNRLYALLNDRVVQDAVVLGAAARFGYEPADVELRLYVGRFAGDKRGDHERAIRVWADGPPEGLRPFTVYGVQEVAAQARRLARSKTYRDNPALVAIKVLEQAAQLVPVDEPVAEDGDGAPRGQYGPTADYGD